MSRGPVATSSGSRIPRAKVSMSSAAIVGSKDRVVWFQTPVDVKSGLPHLGDESVGLFPSAVGSAQRLEAGHHDTIDEVLQSPIPFSEM